MGFYGVNMYKVAYIFPGQGAQVPKMGYDFYRMYSIAKEVFQEADDILSFALTRLIFQGDLRELTETKNSQPAIYVASYAILRVLEKEFPDLLPSVCGGLSLGEYTALTAARKISFEEGLKLVAARGAYMQEACQQEAGSMAAVMGLSEDEIKKAGFWVANLNCPGQVVIAGTTGEMERAKEVLKEKGAKRIIPLEVSGAFHTPLMLGAKEKMRPLIAAASIQKSDIEIAMNVVGRLVSDPEEMRELLIEQITSPTRWMDCVNAMSSVSCFYEIGPSQLTGMNRKIGVSAPTIKIEKVEDLENVHETIAG